MVIVVVGGAGAMGKAAVRELVDHPEVEKIVIADVRLDAARALINQIGSDKLVACRVDVNDAPSLEAALRGATVTVNCTWYEFNVGVMEACLRANCHYVDLGGLYHVTKKQLALHQQFEAAGLSAVLGMGASPGMTNVCVGMALKRMDRIRGIHIRTGARGGKGFAYAARTIIDELTLKPVIMLRGRLCEVEPFSGRERYVLPDPVGEVEGFYAIHSELATLPNIPGITDVTFRVAFSPHLVAVADVLRDLGLLSSESVEIKGVWVSPKEFLYTYLSRLPEPTDLTEYKAFRVDVRGEEGGREVRRIYEIAVPSRPEWNLRATAVWTGVPAALGAVFVARGEVPPGVHAPDRALDCDDFSAALATRGLSIRESIAEVR